MGVQERREREKQDVQQRILDAARELFAREGYDAVTMRRIAQAIEYSPTAIYGHFRDKESLIRAICDTDFLTLAKAFQKLAKEKDSFLRLRKAGIAYVDFAVTHPNHYRLMFMSSRGHDGPPDPEKQGNPERDAYAFLLGSVKQAIADGKLRKDLTDPDLVAQALWSATHGVVALQIALAGDPWIQFRPMKKIALVVIDGILRGFANGASGGLLGRPPEPPWPGSLSEEEEA